MSRRSDWHRGRTFPASLVRWCHALQSVARWGGGYLLAGTRVVRSQIQHSEANYYLLGLDWIGLDC
jgi:hypothetical protein